MSSEKRIAFVTGASRGIGKAIALALGKQDLIVAGTATTQAGADSISAFLEESGIAGRGYELNVTDPEAIYRIIDQVTADFAAPLIVINNAAITADNIMLRMKEHEWDSVIDTNLNSVFHVSKACLKGMIKARWGRIVSISSVVGVTGNPGQANYAAAKAGVIGFTKSLAQEVAVRNVTVNVVAPGFINTDMTRALSPVQRENLLSKIPASRLGEPEEIADLVTFLASDKAGYITGQTLHVNGGMFC